MQRRARETKMSRKLSIALLATALVTGVALIAWSQLGTSTRARRCCGTNCWEVDDEGQPLNPDDAYCESATIDQLPEPEAR